MEYSCVCDDIHMYHLTCSCYSTTQRGWHTSRRSYASMVDIRFPHSISVGREFISKTLYSSQTLSTATN